MTDEDAVRRDAGSSGRRVELAEAALVCVGEQQPDERLVPPPLAWGLWQVHNALFTLNTASLAIVLVSISIGGHRAGLLRGWQHTLSLTSASLLAVSAALTGVTLDGHPASLLGLAGFLMWLVWIASVSTALLRPSGDRHGFSRRRSRWPEPRSAGARRTARGNIRPWAARS